MFKLLHKRLVPLVFSLNPLLISTIVLLTCAFSIQAAKVDPTGPFNFTGKTAQKIAEKKLVLTSIIHGEGIHTAVINGKIMKPFDTIGEYKLTAINDQSVILRRNGQRLKLYIFKEDIVHVSGVNSVVKK